MRETLRMMGLSQISYAMSFVLFQGIFAILGGIIMGLFLFNNEMVFPNDTKTDSLTFVLLLVLLQVAMIPLTMALSTLF